MTEFEKRDFMVKNRILRYLCHVIVLLLSIKMVFCSRNFE